MKEFHKFYFSTTSTALTDYLNNALIKGAILRERPFKFKGENVCLELILSDDEKNKLEKVEDNFYAYKFALPISRIRMIVFENNEQLERTTNTANVTTIFILKDMCVVLKLEQFNKPNLEVINNVKKEDSARFDRYLGAIAFLRYKTYGDEIMPAIFGYLDYFLGKNKKMPFEDFEKIKNILEGQLTENDIREYASKNGLSYKQKEVNKVFKQDDELLNILAQIWYYCSDESSKNISDLLQVKPYKLPAEKDFYFALGYFRGYAKFANSEMGKKIKFEFNKFDLTIIEIVFCFVFSQNLNKEIIDYIDNSRILDEHFCNLMLYSSDSERQISINSYNCSISYSKQQGEILCNKISELQDENKNLSSKVEDLQNELQREILKNDISNNKITKLEQGLEEEKKSSEILRNEISKLQGEIKSLQDENKNKAKKQTKSKKTKDNKEQQLPGTQ